MDVKSSLGGRWTFLEEKPSPAWNLLHVTRHPGEEVVVEAHRVLLLNTKSLGRLVLTTLRLLFIADNSEQLHPLGSFSVAAVERVAKLPSSGGGGVSFKGAFKLLQVLGKDLRTVVYAFRPRTCQRSTVHDAVLSLLPRKLLDVHALATGGPLGLGPDPAAEVSGEYGRLLGILDARARGQWRVSRANCAYGVCSTYPASLVLPSALSDEEISAAAAFRARGRLPVFCWQHPRTGAVLSRAGQPLVGIMLNSRSDADEKLVAALTGTGSAPEQPPRKLVIADARPRKNALANGALGGGSEPAGNYRASEVVYLGIDNIHAMRDSMQRLRDYLDVHGAACSDGSSSLLRSGGGSWAGGSVSSTAGAAPALADTGWLQHVHALLAGGVFIAARMELEGSSVLVHCSDGWDRTPALLCTALLLLDPFYRTFQGFQALVELHWAAFGHQFAERLGLPGASGLSAPLPGGAAAADSPFPPSGGSVGSLGGSVHCPPSSSALRSPSGSGSSGGPGGGASTAHQAPIFLQWVDCVGQLLRIFPAAFQFSSAFLVDLLDCALAGRFGNFLCNSEKERVQSGVWRRCACVWQHLALQRAATGPASSAHCNVFYAPLAHPAALLPPAAALSPVLLPELYLRWSCPSPTLLERAQGSLPEWWECGGHAQRALLQREAVAEEVAEASKRQVAALQEELACAQLDCQVSLERTRQAEAVLAELLQSLQVLGIKCQLPEPGSSTNGPSIEAPSTSGREGAAGGPAGETGPGLGQLHHPLNQLAITVQISDGLDCCELAACKKRAKGIPAQGGGEAHRKWTQQESSIESFRADFDALARVDININHFSGSPPLKRTIGS